MDKMNLFGSSTKTYTDTKNQYDANFKKLFSRPEVLAGVLINVVPELNELSYSDVCNRIERSEINNSLIKVLDLEDVENDKKIIYDILVLVRLTEGTQPVHLIFDLEMQRNFRAGYDLEARAIYYTSRLMAKQPIRDSEFDSLLPVKSVWICTNRIPKKLQDKVINFELVAKDSEGNSLSNSFKHTDLFGFTFILLSKNYDWNTEDDSVVKYLHAIFSNNLSNKEFNPYLKVTEDIKREVLAVMTEQRQYEKEMDAVAKDSREEGREEMLIKFVATQKSQGMSEFEIKSNLKLYFELDDDEILKFF